MIDQIFETLIVFVEWLIKTSFKASILVCLILLFQFLIGDKISARWRYFLWFILLLRLIIPFEFVGDLSLHNLLSSEKMKNVETVSRSVDKFIEVSIQPEIKISPEIRQRSNDNNDKLAKSLQNDSNFSPLQIISLIWISGVFLLIFYTTVNNYRLYRRFYNKSPVMSSESITLFNQCKKSMNISLPIHLYESPVIRVPVLYGFFKSYILLPSKFINSLSKNDLRHIFLHELAHFKHYDNKIAWAMTILQILHWFNPVIWYAFFRMRVDRELACDELTLTNLGEKSKNDYGKTLVSLLEHISLSERLPISVKIIDNKHGLKRRIKKIVNFKNKSIWWSILAGSLLFVLANISLTDANPGNQTSNPYAAEVLLTIENNSMIKVGENVVPIDSLLNYINRFSYDENSLIAILPKESIEVKTYYKILEQLQSIDVLRVKYINNKNGKIFITPNYKFEGLAWDANALIPKNIEGKYGFMNRDKELVIAPKYERVGMFVDGIANVSLNNKWGLINKEGEEIIEFKYEHIGFFSDGLAEVKTKDKYGFINLKGEIIIEPEYDHAYSFLEGLAPVKKNDRYGYINTTGEVIIPFKYERAGEFWEGLALVKLNNKWGYINMNGQIVVDYIYEFADRFQNSRALIRKDDKYGYIDRTGAIVVNPQFTHADEFSEGLAAVSIDGKYGFIDIYGNIVIKPQFDYTMGFMHGVGTGITFEDPQLGIKAKTTSFDKAGNILAANRKMQ